MSNNPLMNFARKVEISVKLPTNGGWYDDGMIDYTPNGEVEVYPMLPKDELMLLNPDAVLSGQSNINMIASCVPSIKEPGKLYYPDANVLFLSIQKATYGDSFSIRTPCPFCRERMETMTEEEIEQEKKDGKLQHDIFEAKYSISSFLEQIKYLDKEAIVETDNGLKIYVTPNTIYDKAKYKNITLSYEKLIKISREEPDQFEKLIHDNNTAEELNNLYQTLSLINMEIISECIQKVVLPDESVVSDKKMIFEFITNSPSNVVGKINTTIMELNNIGLPTTIDVKCPCCGKEWKDKFYGYNQSDFFGIGSLI